MRVCSYVLAVVIGLGLGCQRSSTPDPPGDETPVAGVELRSPRFDEVATVGAVTAPVVIEFASAATGTTTIFADRDGVFDTTDDRILVATQPAAGGAAQSATWNPGGVPLGSYSILAIHETPDGSTATAAAPGRVNVIDPYLATREGFNFGFVTGFAASDDGSYVTATSPAGTAIVLSFVYGIDGVNETEFTNEAWNGEPPTSLHHFIQPNPFPSVHLARYSPSGEFRWARRFGGNISDGSGYAIFNAVAAQPDGSTILAGSYRKEAHFGDTVLRGANAYIARIDRDGNPIWVRNLPPGARPSAMAGCPAGGFVVWGVLPPGRATFDPGEDSEVMIGDGTATEFLASFDEDGRVRWARAVQGQFPGPPQLTVSAEGSVTLLGYATRAVFDEARSDESRPPASSIYLVRFDADGEFRWLRSIGGVFYAARVQAIENDGVAISGATLSPITFPRLDGSGVTFTDGSVEQNATFVARFDATGDLEAARQLEPEFGNIVARYSRLHFLRDGSFVVAGYLSNFGPGQRRTLEPAAGAGDPTTIGLPDRNSTFVVRFDRGGVIRWARTDAATPLHFRYMHEFRDGSLLLLGVGEEATFGKGTPRERSFAIENIGASFALRLTREGRP